MRSGRGFTLAGLLIVVAVMGAGLAAAGALWSHSAQREKEQELLFAGNQFRQAIAGYYQRSPGAKHYPPGLEDLLRDRRYPMPQRYLRKLYRDPMTGAAEWGLIPAPGGGVMGVHSLSEEEPIKTGGFAQRDRALEGATRYSEWRFVFAPPDSPSGLGRGR